MHKRSPAMTITRPAAFIALLVAAQFATAPLGNTLLTGSLVNFLLVTSVMITGPAASLPVAVISPVLAKLIGIGPLWGIIPFIAIANAAFILVWHFAGNAAYNNKTAVYLSALIAGSLVKFILLYAGVAKFAVPILLKLPEKQAAVISGMFSAPQLITASIGGVLALAALPVIKKAIRKTSPPDDE